MCYTFTSSNIFIHLPCLIFLYIYCVQCVIHLLCLMYYTFSLSNVLLNYDQSCICFGTINCMYEAFSRLFQFTGLERCNKISVIWFLMVFIHNYQVKRFLNSNIITTYINIDTYYLSMMKLIWSFNNLHNYFKNDHMTI